jgi:hypothetical protein
VIEVHTLRASPQEKAKLTAWIRAKAAKIAARADAKRRKAQLLAYECRKARILRGK